MRLKVTREISCAWETPVRAVIAALRVMPLDHDGQAVVSWRIEPSIDGRLRSSADAFGNMLHHLQADGPFEALTIRVDGLVDLSDQAGVVRGAREAAPPMLFLRDSALTAPDDGVRSFAARSVAAAASPLDRAHALAGAAAELGASEAARSSDSAREVMAGGSADAIARVHLLCAAARSLGVPARIVLGLADCSNEHASVSGAHSWAELHVEGLGWIAFDPVLRLCPTDRHVRVAIGLDASDANAIRLAATGAAGETISVQDTITALE